jgi:hypothetical protein
MNITANEQSFQSVYLDPDTKDWRDRIVFHEPIFQDEMAAVISLKSLELENLIGLVIAAPLNVLRHFRELVKDSDHTQGWGNKEAATIIAKLIKAIKDLGATIVYEQLGNEVPNIPPELLPEGDDNERSEAYFFDPLTKRRIVEKGPHYFDPSLITLEDVARKMKRRTKEKAENRAKPKNPSIGAYPDNITNHGRRVWDDVMTGHGVDINKYQTPKERWDYATYIYETKCDQIGVPAYLPLADANPAIILKKLESCKRQAADLLAAVLTGLKKRGISRQRPTRELAFDVRQMGDNNFYLTTSRFLKLDGLGTTQQVLDLLAKEYNFFLAKTRRENGFKPVNDMTKLTVSDSEKPQHVVVYTTYMLPSREAGILCKTGNTGDMINRLMKLLNLWVKTGRLKR